MWVGYQCMCVCVCVWGGRAGPVKPFVSSAVAVWWDAIPGRVVPVIRGSADVMNNPWAWHRHKGRSETTHTHSLARFRNTFHPGDSPPYHRVYLITPSPLVLIVGDLWLCSFKSPTHLFQPSRLSVHLCRGFRLVPVSDNSEREGFH